MLGEMEMERKSLSSENEIHCCNIDRCVSEFIFSVFCYLFHIVGVESL